MKKLLVLMAAVVLTSSVVGCSYCQRLRNRWNQGAICTPPMVGTAVVGMAPICDTACTGCESCQSGWTTCDPGSTVIPYDVGAPVQPNRPGPDW